MNPVGSPTPAEETRKPPAPVRTASLIFILGALSAFGPLSLDMYLPALPALAADLGTGASQAQLSLSLCLLGLALGQLAAGPASDVLGRRRPLLLGLGIFTLTSLLCALCTNIWLFVLLRFLQGLAGSVGIVLSRAVLRDMFDGKELTRSISLIMLVNGAAPILAPIFGGMVLGWASWRGIFAALTLVGALMLASVLLKLPESLPEERRIPADFGSTLAAFGTLLKDPSFVGLALAQGLVYAAMFAYIAGSPFVLQGLFGISPQTFSLVFAVNGIGIIAASHLTGLLVRRAGEDRLMVWGILQAWAGGLLLLIAVLLDRGLPGILPALFLIVSSVGIVATAGTSLALQQYSRSAGSASALLGVLSYVAGSTVTPLAGVGGTQSSLPMSLIILASVTIAVLFYFLLAVKKSRH